MTQEKAKRKLSDIDFQKEGAHIALVHKNQGGGANGHNYSMLIKATNSSEEFLKKVQQIRVTMDLPEFLWRFFGMWEDDAELLAGILGYVDEEDAKESTDPTDLSDVYESAYASYIKEKLKSFEILKSAYDAEQSADSEENAASVISKCSETEYLNVLKDQALFEKALRKKERADQKLEKQRAKADLAAEANSMEKKSVSDTKDQVDVATLQKSLDDTAAELQKATALIEEFKKEKAEAIVKSKTAKVTEIVKDSPEASIIVKAALALNDEDFEPFVAAVQTVYTQIEKSALFRETGAAATGTDNQADSGVGSILKSKFNKENK
jgi:hypothetical protein